MQRWLLKSKLHRARVTGTVKDYEESIAIDSELLSEADVTVGERVQIVNVTNGERFETYTASPVRWSSTGPLRPTSGLVWLNFAVLGDAMLVWVYDFREIDALLFPQLTIILWLD